MRDWNPNSYLKFKNERTQPSIDLVSRINIPNAASIIDIGCGAGNSTQILYEKWPAAEITGLDSSPEMINRAKNDYPKLAWILADISAYKSLKTFDVVFSNAALQWVHNHEALIQKLLDMTSKNGALAVQVPANQNSPLHKALLAVSKSGKWEEFTGECDKLLNYQSLTYYYDILNQLIQSIELWETEYIHILAGHQALIEWYKSTGMRPYLDRLPDDLSRKQFEDDILEICREEYAIQKNGKILYPFRRLFFVAIKK